MPIFKLVSEKENLTICELSESLIVTQPTVNQFVNYKLISAKVDKRKRKVSLSKKGDKMLIKLNSVWKAVDNEIKKLTRYKNNKSLLTHISYMEIVFKKNHYQIEY